MMATLQLAVKGEYFDAVKLGEKTEEYRLVNAYWGNRIFNRWYDTLINGGSKIIFRDEGSWSGLRMNASVRNMLSAAVNRMKFMRGLK